jgi:hypothetical protein
VTGPDRPPFAFIVACGRSGTTLLRAMLDTHPDMAIPPETKFILTLLGRGRRYESPEGFRVDAFVTDLRWAFGLRELGLTVDEARSALEPPPADTPDAIRRAFRRYAERRGKARYGNKTPVHVLSIARLAEAFPEARFIHIIRDGRDVALSYLASDVGPDSLEGAALRWRRWVRRGRAAGRGLGPNRYLEVRYEDLAADPEATLRRIGGFLGLPYDAAMLRYFERANEVIEGTRRPHNFERLHLPPTPGLRDWRRELTPRERAVFEVLAGDLLADLGYEVEEGPPGAAVRVRARAGAALAEARRALDAVGRATFVPIRRRIRRPRAMAASDR